MAIHVGGGFIRGQKTKQHIGAQFFRHSKTLGRSFGKFILLHCGQAYGDKNSATKLNLTAGVPKRKFKLTMSYTVHYRACAHVSSAHPYFQNIYAKVVSSAHPSKPFGPTEVLLCIICFSFTTLQVQCGEVLWACTGAKRRSLTF